MIAAVIDWSLRNRIFVLLAAAAIALLGTLNLDRTRVDALPDLSATQVIIRTAFANQAPQVVEDQVTYPLATRLLQVPGATDVRGYSFYGDSYIYVLFREGTDPYWARSRVQEYLTESAAALPQGATPRLGPAASGVGWIYQYALVDRSGRHDLSDLRSLQDWFLRFELAAIEGVAEVATVGGMERQYQVVVDPNALRLHGLTLDRVIAAVRAGNQEVGGSVLELAEAEVMIRGRGYVDALADLEHVPLTTNADGTPLRLGDVAEVRLGPAPRRGVAELDGQGEVVGGIVVMRYGQNARELIERIEQRLEDLAGSLPDGVEVVETYNRAGLIDRAVANLQSKLVLELAAVALVCLVFLLHLRSALVALVSLPLGVLMALLVMNAQGVTANIMSLGGIALAIGAMVDAAVVMIENTHKRLERFRMETGRLPTHREHWALVREATQQVGPALFFSLMIVTVSFLPVLTLQAEEGRLFRPLAYTKTYAMAAATGLAVTLIPVLIGLAVRGRILAERRHPVSRALIAGYRPLLVPSLRAPRLVILLALAVGLSGLLPWVGLTGLLAPLKWPVTASTAVLGPPAAQGPRQAWLQRVDRWQAAVAQGWQAVVPAGSRWADLATGLGSEFMPNIDEGDLLYMPTTLPGISIGKARELLQQTDRLIAQVPEVARVFGKVGRADTATDPAPLTMIETTIMLKPKDQWRRGLTMDDLIAELDATVDVPGLTNAWVPPIKTRIDMLSTGIKTPVGVKITGPNLTEIQKIGESLERVLATLPGTSSVYSERVAEGRYLEIRPDRAQAARYGLNIEHTNTIIASAIGGATVTETVQGRERYPINVRYPRAARADLEALERLPVVTPTGASVPLGQIAEIALRPGPPMIKSENARLTGWTFVDVRGTDLGSYLRTARAAVAEQVDLPAGYALTWAGQFEAMQRAQARLGVIVPVTLAAILALLYAHFRRGFQTWLVVAVLPFALSGAVWLLWLLAFDWSVAVVVGMLALAGVAVEFAVIMLLYIDHAVAARAARGALSDRADLRAAIIEGAVQRIRPKIMTVATLLAGLFPLLLGAGTGSEVLQRIAAPMIGGMMTAPLATLVVLPCLYMVFATRIIDTRPAS